MQSSSLNHSSRVMRGTRERAFNIRFSERQGGWRVYGNNSGVIQLFSAHYPKPLFFVTRCYKVWNRRLLHLLVFIYYFLFFFLFFLASILARETELIIVWRIVIVNCASTILVKLNIPTFGAHIIYRGVLLRIIIRNIWFS